MGSRGEAPGLYLSRNPFSGPCQVNDAIGDRRERHGMGGDDRGASPCGLPDGRRPARLPMQHRDARSARRGSRIDAGLSSARASAIRRRSPPDNPLPRSSTNVPSPPGRLRSIVQSPTRSATAAISAAGASRRDRAMFSAMLPGTITGACPIQATDLATDPSSDRASSSIPHLAAGERHQAEQQAQRPWSCRNRSARAAPRSRRVRPRS